MYRKIPSLKHSPIYVTHKEFGEHEFEPAAVTLKANFPRTGVCKTTKRTHNVSSFDSGNWVNCNESHQCNESSQMSHCSTLTTAYVTQVRMRFLTWPASSLCSGLHVVATCACEPSSCRTVLVRAANGDCLLTAGCTAALLPRNARHAANNIASQDLSNTQFARLLFRSR